MTQEEILSVISNRTKYQNEIHGPMGGVNYATQIAIERLTDYIKKLEKRIIELENKENQK